MELALGPLPAAPVPLALAPVGDPWETHRMWPRLSRLAGTQGRACKAERLDTVSCRHICTSMVTGIPWAVFDPHFPTSWHCLVKGSSEMNRS